MPSTFFGLNTAYTGLLAANAAQNTTANNIANADTEGYSRQKVKQQAANALRTFQAYGCAGAGVETLAIEQIRDEFYDMRFWTNNAKVGEYGQKQYYMTMLEDYFDDSAISPGFKTFFDQLMTTGLEELLKNPSNATTKSQFVGYASSLADYFNNLAGNLENLQKDLNQELKAKVDELNSLAAEIATLNKQINTIELTGVKANELRDRRALLIDKLSEIVDVEVTENPVYDTNNPDRETGAHRFMVRIAGGQILVDGNEYNGLECVARKDYEKVNQTDVDGLYDVYWKGGDKFNLYNTAMSGALRGIIDLRDGNNNENFRGLISGIGKDENGKDTVTVQVGVEYLKDLNKCNLSGSGVINLGNQEFYYDSWEYTISYDDDGNPVYSYKFTLSDDKALNPRSITNDRVGKLAETGASITYQGIPYYMSQMNEWLRTFAQKFNDILTSGFNTNGNQGIPLFSADHATDGEQYDFPDEYRYDWYYGKTRDQVWEELKQRHYTDLYNDEYEIVFENLKTQNYTTYYTDKLNELMPIKPDAIDELAEKLKKQDPNLTDSEAQTKAKDQLEQEAKDAADQAALAQIAADAVEEMKDPTIQAQLDADAAAAADADLANGVFTVGSDGSKYDSYFQMTAMNFAILAAMELDPSQLANRYAQGDGAEQNDLLKDLQALATDKTKMSFRGSSASEFLQCILSDVTLNAYRANTFYQSYYDISGTIDVQRMSISGVDEDEEAVNLVKYQHGYNLACQMIQTLSEMYDRLILETGV